MYITVPSQPYSSRACVIPASARRNSQTDQGSSCFLTSDYRISDKFCWRKAHQTSDGRVGGYGPTRQADPQRGLFLKRSTACSQLSREQQKLFDKSLRGAIQVLPPAATSRPLIDRYRRIQGEPAKRNSLNVISADCCFGPNIRPARRRRLLQTYSKAKWPSSWRIRRLLQPVFIDTVPAQPLPAPDPPCVSLLHQTCHLGSGLKRSNLNCHQRPSFRRQKNGTPFRTTPRPEGGI